MVNLYMSGVPQIYPRHLYPKNKAPLVVFASRPLFETTLRRMVLKNCANVTYQSASVTGFIRSDSSRNQLAGVKVRTKGGKESRISASLVVGAHRFPLSYHSCGPDGMLLMLLALHRLYWSCAWWIALAQRFTTGSQLFPCDSTSRIVTAPRHQDYI